MARPQAQRIEFIGLNKVVRDLSKLPGNIDRELVNIGLEAAKPLIAHAKSIAPVRSGKLRASIRSAPTKRGVVVRAGNPGKLSYGNPIHWGWFYDQKHGIKKNIMPNPFLYKALGYTRQEIFDNYDRNIKNIIKKHNL